MGYVTMVKKALIGIGGQNKCLEITTATVKQGGREGPYLCP